MPVQKHKLPWRELLRPDHRNTQGLRHVHNQVGIDNRHIRVSA